MSHVKKIKPFFIDERGEMSHIVNREVKFTGALLITSKKGSIRANHYHKKDTHYSYLISGKMEYTHYDANSRNKKRKTVIVKAGEMIHTPPMVAHAMRFLEDSTFLALTTQPREQNKYEKDTVRVNVI